MKNKRFFKIIITTITIYILTVIHTYLCMNEYSKSPSSTCFNCSYVNEVIRYSFMSTFILPILLTINKLKLSKKTVFFLCIFFFTLFIFLININLFEARVSSWSTYTDTEFYISVLMKVIFTLPIFVFLFSLYLNFYYLNSKN